MSDHWARAGQCGQWTCFIFLSMCHASPRHVVSSTHCFFNIFPRVIAISRHSKNVFKNKFLVINLKIFRSSNLLNSPFSTQQSSFTSSGLQIFPYPSQKSSSTPYGGQINHSPLSGHPQTLLAVKFTPPRPAIILKPYWRSNSPPSAQSSSSPPFWRSNSPLPTQQSSSTPTGG